jgi:hypothetical protein
MERTKSRLLEFLNMDIGISLERWKYNPQSVEDMAALNELFRLAEKMKINMTLEVHKEAIDKKTGDDFIMRILPQEAKIYGKELENSWVFSIPPKLKHQSPDPYVLNATNASGESHLLLFHMYHGGIASFRPSDVIAITIK